MNDATEQAAADALSALTSIIAEVQDPADRISLLNNIRRALHELSPLRHHPVDFVEWVPAGIVEANDYNPNHVAPPEMELLRLSIDHDGYTQPVVTYTNGSDTREVVDGFHRRRVASEYPEVTSSLLGFLPTVQIRAETADRSDRIAATIRHNRARGKHQVVKMTDIVLELKRRNWSDSKIGRNLGMDPDEVLRLCQIGGLADAFADHQFSEAWEVDMINESDDLEDEAEGVGTGG
jgi:ParB-like chromosome segregation protein Spo0J